MKSILITDDEKNIRLGLERAFVLEGYRALVASSGEEALAIIERDEIDLLICDLRMPVMDGHVLMLLALKLRPSLQIIMMTAHGTVETAVRAMQQGAYNFLSKPLNLEHLFILTKRALRSQALEEENLHIKSQIESKSIDDFNGFIGTSNSMKKLYNLLKQASPTNASILILGESGVGKELAANAIHVLSKRKDGPFIKVNCAALAENLLESELFGHEKGAFTGASTRRKGRFEMANGGDIFLDEIGELSHSLQVKLLRVLQERSFERVGGENTIRVDIRIMAATNLNLENEVVKGNFREDLYYRLNVMQVFIPPLRERTEDIEQLAINFLQQLNLENNKKIESLSDKVLEALKSYRWPGNVRQLRNCIESAVVLTSGRVIEKEALPSYIIANVVNDDDYVKLPLNLTARMAQDHYIKAIITAEHGNKSSAAKRLGVSRKTLQRRGD